MRIISISILLPWLYNVYCFILYEIKSHYVELLAILQVVTLAHFSTNDIYREYAFNLIAGTQSTKQKRIVKNT